MIEVFKTNVRQKEQARMLIAQIQKAFCDYKVNFDLDDCDNILRVKSKDGMVRSSCLIDLLRQLGFHAEILPDTHPPRRLLLPAGKPTFINRINRFYYC
jgi:hypothetical protein